MSDLIMGIAVGFIVAFATWRKPPKRKKSNVIEWPKQVQA